MKDYALRVVVTLLIILAFIVIPLAIYYVLPHFTPFFLAFFIALLLEPIFRGLTRSFKVYQPLSVLLTYLVFTTTLGLLLFILIYRLIRQAIEWLTYLQTNASHINDWILQFIRQFQEAMDMLPPSVSEQISQSLTTFAQFITSPDIVSKIGSLTLSITTAVPNFFILTLIFLIALYLFCLQLDNIRRGFFSLFKPATVTKLKIFLGDLKKSLAGFVVAHLILSTITFLFAFIGLSILKVNYAAIYALLATLVDLLPIVGIGTALVPWALISIFTGNVFLGIGLLILFAVILVTRKAVEPKILGERIGLSPLTTLISIWVGFKLMGLMGIFLIPFLVIVIKAIFRSGLININLRLL